MARLRILACLLAAPAAAAACPVGVYRGAADEKVIVTSHAEAGAPLVYWYTMLDGRRGSLTDPASPFRCDDAGFRQRRGDGWSPVWQPVAIKETPTHFRSLGTELYGLLVEPGDAPANRPLVVFVHGSEKTSDIGISYQYVFAAQGISVFMYDKRGTGLSDGFYTQNFELLAVDAAAAREARRIAAGRFGRWGYFGGSQGGWVAPRAAQIGGADFVAVGFGLVLSPLEEDSEQVFFELRRKGYGDDVIGLARRVTDATDALVASHLPPATTPSPRSSAAMPAPTGFHGSRASSPARSSTPTRPSCAGRGPPGSTASPSSGPTTRRRSSVRCRRRSCGCWPTQIAMPLAT